MLLSQSATDDKYNYIYDMKKLFILLLLSLVSCMSANKHFEKAIKKGYTPEKETIEVETLAFRHFYDTITNEIIRTDTVITRETRTVFQDRPITRQERLMYKDSLSYLKAEIKNERKKEKETHEKDLKRAKIKFDAYKDYVKIKTKPKNNLFDWLKWLVISFGLGFLTAVFRKQLLKLLLKIPLPFK